MRYARYASDSDLSDDNDIDSRDDFGRENNSIQCELTGVVKCRTCHDRYNGRETHRLLTKRESLHP